MTQGRNEMFVEPQRSQTQCLAAEYAGRHEPTCGTEGIHVLELDDFQTHLGKQARQTARVITTLMMDRPVGLAEEELMSWSEEHQFAALLEGMSHGGEGFFVISNVLEDVEADH